MPILDVLTHPLSMQCWTDSQAAEERSKGLGIDPDSDRIDELDFYTYRVAHSVAHLTAWAEQLNDVPVYLSSFKYSSATGQVGVTRAKYLLYTVENYLVRLQSIYDRCLQLTNCVFNLCIEETNVGHELIVSNLKVARTNVPAALRKVRKSVSHFQQSRNRIIHHASYQEQDLDRLQLFYMYTEENYEEVVGLSFSRLKIIRSRLLRKVVAEKTAQFNETNEKLFIALCELLTVLHVHYKKFHGQVASYAR